MKKNDDFVDISLEEEAFRRGYHHGFIAGRSQADVTIDEVRIWRYSMDKENVCPPGSPLEGMSRDINRPIEQIVDDISSRLGDLSEIDKES